MDTCCSIWNEHSGASAGKVPWVTPRKPVCSPVLHLQMMLLLLIKQWAGEEEAGCALLAWAAGSSGNMKQGEYVFYLSFCSLESNLRAADGRAKRWCLVMNSGTGRGEKGEICRCDRDSPANQIQVTWFYRECWGYPCFCQQEWVFCCNRAVLLCSVSCTEPFPHLLSTHLCFCWPVLNMLIVMPWLKQTSNLILGFTSKFSVLQGHYKSY